MSEPPIVSPPKIAQSAEPPTCTAPRTRRESPKNQTPSPAPAQSKWSFVLENRLAMFGMLFFVTGFLGIPFLWMSPRFSHAEKVVWSIVVTIYTLALIGLTAGILWWSYQQISQSLAF